MEQKYFVGELEPFNGYVCCNFIFVLSVRENSAVINILFVIHVICLISDTRRS